MPIASTISLPDIHPFVGMDVSSLLADSARSNGDRLFLAWEPFEGRARAWSYAEADRAVTDIAAGLAERGLRPGDALILHLDNAPESILVWLACGRLGAVAVVTNARSSADELRYFVEKSGAVAIVSQPAFSPVVGTVADLVDWTELVEPGTGDQVLRGARTLAPRPADPAAPFCVQFTSGTTSRPKAVVWTHANALWGAMVNARHLSLRPEDKALVFFPLCHAVALSWQVLGSIWAGAAVVVQPKFSAARFWEVVTSHGCTWAPTGGFVENALKDVPRPEGHRLRFVLATANLEPSEAAWRLRNTAGHGMTEIITQSLLCDTVGPIENGAVGRPAPEYRIEVRDDDGKAVPLGGSGELLIGGIRGLSLFACYHGDEQATAEAFTEDGLFRTGDIVRRRPDGALDLVDRKKDMLKVGGENVAASEVEAVILKVPGVREVAVVGQRHKMLDEVPFAFVIATPAAPADLPDRILAACRAALADFKVPREVRLVEDFPRTIGELKVRKVRLREMLRDEAQA